MRNNKFDQHFGLISLFLISLLGIVLWVTLDWYKGRHVGVLIESQNIMLSHSLKTFLRDDLDALVRHETGSSQALLASNDVRNKLAPLVATEGFTKIKIFRPDGLTVFSTDAQEIGEDAAASPGVIAARNGKLFSEFVHRSDHNGPNHPDLLPTLISSYIPAFDDQKPVAIVEFYQDISRLNQVVEEEHRQMLALMLVLLGILYAIQFSVFNRIRSKLSAERACIAEKASLMEATIEASHNGILVVNTAGRITYANHRFAQMWMIPEALMAEGDDRAVMHYALDQLQDPEEFKLKVKNLYRNPEHSSDDLVKFRDGRIFRRLSQPQVLHKNILGRVWSFLDITEQHNAHQRELQLSEAISVEFARSARQKGEMQTLLRAIPDLVWMKDVDGVYVSCNAAFEALTGVQQKNLVGKTDFELFPQTQATHFREDDLKAMHSAQPITIEEWVSYPEDGRQALLQTTKTAVLKNDGTLIGVLGIARDITESKAVLNALHQARSEAHSANEAKSRFLANMSHEIRTPMNAIIGMADLCLGTSLDKRQKNYIEKIKSASDNLLEIINEILDFSKIEAGQVAIEKIPFELESVLTQASTVTSLRAEHQGIELNYDVDPAIPKTLIGDPLRLGQVLINLIANAIKFSAGGNVVLSIQQQGERDGRHEIQFSVTDQGIGMTAEQLAKLFKPFSQADSSTTRRHGGTGLGLAISQHLIGLMGGKIKVDSTPNVGTTFSFVLPMETPAAESTKAMKTVSTLGKSASSVMVVDDNPLARRILERILEKLGMTVLVAHSGEEALALARKPDFPPCLACFIDWRMPGIDGIETIRQLRAHFSSKPEQLVQPALILVTAYSHHEGLLEIDGDVDSLLAKPFSIAQVQAELMRCHKIKEESEVDRNTVEEALDWSSFSGLDILVVEDIDINQEVILELGHDVGLQLRLADNGAAALAEIERKTPDLVLMDCQMPVMDGFTATRKLREDSRWKSLPIIALTANAMKADRLACENAGMDGYVSKPIRMNALHAELSRVISAKSTASPLPEHQASRTEENMAKHLENLPGIDIGVALSNVGGRKNTLHRLLENFRENLAARFPGEIASALARNDRATAERLAHSIKGVAYTLGAVSLGDSAVTLQQSLAADDPVAVSQDLDQVLKALATVVGGLSVMQPTAS